MFDGNDHLVVNDEIPDIAYSILDTSDTDSSGKPKDRYGDVTTQQYVSPLYLLNLPSNHSVDFELSEDGKGFYVYEKIGDFDYKPPVYITYEEYLEYLERKHNQDYFREKSKTSTTSSNQTNTDINSLIPKQFNVKSGLLETIFGSSKIEIRPNITALLTFSGRVNRINNPILPIQQQRNTAFNFDQQIQMNVIGKIGERLTLNANWDTKATFDFENQLKVAFGGGEDDILQTVEAGNVSLPLNNSLITGGQNLFGIKMGMKFGALNVTAIASQQKGQTQSVTVQGGSQKTEFNIDGNDYDEQRHFFIAHHFQEQYDKALSGLPNIQSNYNITRIEVWVTNISNSSTVNNRDVVGFVDLGEGNPSNIYNNTAWDVSANTSTIPNSLSDNASNGLYTQLNANPNIRIRKNTITELQLANFGSGGVALTDDIDFKLVENMRKLNTNEFTYNAKLGYISLNSKLQANQNLFVAYQYQDAGTGKSYQVGEFSQDYPADPTNPNVLFLKMLKPSSVRPTYNDEPYPTWALQMKNIYSIGGYGLSADDFEIDIVYQSTNGAGNINYIPEGPISNKPLIQVTKLDQLTNNTDQNPDNRFDFIDGVTVIPDRGLLIFPVVEPFGENLKEALNNDQTLYTKYGFPQLYTKTKTDAIQYHKNVDRFLIKGAYKASVGSEIPLNAVQIAPGSIKVTAGGSPLTEGVDYTVDYNIGKVIIINSSLLTSGQEIKVTFETNTLFNIQTKTLVGARFDYRVSKDFNIGATILHLNERPLTSFVIIGSEPISNTIWGVDTYIKKDSRFITKMLDKLPLISTKEKSTVTFQGEFAQLIPGTPKEVGKNGTAYLDDFESTRAPYDMMNWQNWKLASVPIQGANTYYQLPIDLSGDTTGLAYNFTRAKLSWYQIDPFFYTSYTDLGLSKDDISGQYVRQITPNEVFPNRTLQQGANNYLPTFDLHYQPQKRGMYNYNAISSYFDADGNFVNPGQNWAGIMRKTTGNTDFEAANIEYVEFWMMDPFLENTGSNGGKMVLHLGRVSEDILPDNRRSFENGLPTNESEYTNMDLTNWAYVPVVIPPTNAFSNETSARQFQDAGLDGMPNNVESTIYASFLNQVNTLPISQEAKDALINDPSGDDYQHFREASGGVLQRYAKYNGMEGNSPINAVQNGYSLAATTLPDNEDLNGSNTLDTYEEYWEYVLDLKPSELEIGKNNIVDIRDEEITLANDKTGKAKWYLFRIPLSTGVAKNDIQNFKSIDFMRLFLTQFDEEVVLRFGKFDLVSSQWRTYQDYLGKEGEVINPDPGNNNTNFSIGTVNIEENGSKTPFNYVLPPGIDRARNPGDPTNSTLQNEQSLLLKVSELEDGDARGVFRVVNYDAINYKKLKMYVHAEGQVGTTSGTNFKDRGDATVFIRLGSDYDENYYEYEIPLTPSVFGNQSEDNIWKAENFFDFEMQLLNQAKLLRNNSNFAYDKRYYYQVPGTDHNIYVKGVPQLTQIKVMMIGVRNPDDNKGNVSLEVWADELRLTDFNQTSGWAANAQMNLKLADFANVTMSGYYSTPWFGSLDAKLSERTRETITRYNIAANISLDKLFPKKWGLRLPAYFTYGETFIDPIYDPSDTDVLIENLDENSENQTLNEIKNISQDYTLQKSYSLTNIRKVKTKKDAKSFPWDVENFALTLAYNETFHRNYQVLSDFVKNYRAGINYAYTFKSKPWMPFKNWDFSKKEKKKDEKDEKGDDNKLGKNKYQSNNKNKKNQKNPIKAFNINFLPQSFAFSMTGDRRYGEKILRSNGNNNTLITPVYNKNFTINRTYNLRWNFTKSLSLNYTATNLARVYQPTGRIDTKEKRDSLVEGAFLWGRNTEKGRLRLINMGKNIAFTQSISLTYKLPFQTWKYTDWVRGTVNYTADFQWNNPMGFNDSTLGHIISNGQTVQVNGQLNFGSLYKKFPKLKKALDSRNKPLHKPLPGNIKTKQEIPDSLKQIRKQEFGKRVGNHLLGVLLSMQSIDFTYGRNRTTVLPGFIPETDNFGLDFNYVDTATGLSQSGIPPTLGFILGSQKDIRNQAVNQGWISKDTLLSQNYMTTDATQFTARTSFELSKGLRVDLSVNLNKSDNYSELFKWSESQQKFISSNIISSGNYTASYIALNTAFLKSGEESKAFNKFEQIRSSISQKVAAKNPNADVNSFVSGGYVEGYGRQAQDVVIPAFRAAYGLGGESVGMFPKIPLPNWNINYNGLSNIPALKRTFKSITINHSYRSTYSVPTFTYNVDAQLDDINFNNYSSIRVGDTGNFETTYIVNTVVINESFAPLIGFTMAFKNGINATIDYKQTRNLSLSLGSMQLTEMLSKELTLNIGYKKNKIKKPIKLFGKTFNLKNAFNARMEVTLRDTKTRNRTLDSEIADPLTAGNFNLIIKPSIDYIINNRLNFRFFVERNINRPAISTSFPSSFTNIGIQLRLSITN